MIDARFVDITGVPSPSMFSGVLPEQAPHGQRGCAMFASQFETIPRSQWQDLIAQSSGAETFVKKIKNQLQEGSCVSNATTGAGEVEWNKTNGLDEWVELSAISLYKRVASGPGSGSMLSDNLREMKDRGALPVDNAANRQKLIDLGCDPNHVMPPTGYYTAFPSGWEQTAKYFRIAEYVELSGFDEIATALLKNLPVVFARAGHCIFGAKLVYENGGFLVKYANSWGDWGDNGYGYDTENYFVRSGAAQWAFCPTGLIIPDAEISNLPTPQ